MLCFKALAPDCLHNCRLNRFQEKYANSARVKNAIFRFAAFINCIPVSILWKRHILASAYAPRVVRSSLWRIQKNLPPERVAKITKKGRLKTGPSLR
jgi:hypothetical protein